MMRFRFMIMIAMILMTTRIFAAGDIETLEALGQQQFKKFSEDLTAVASYKAVAPAEPMGTLGFDLGVELTGTQLEYDSLWEDAAGNESFSGAFVVPKLHVHKGLPFNIDVGAFLATAPESNIQLLGGELRYAIVGGNVALPAVAVRLSHTILSGVDQLDFNSTGLELTASKGFLMLTPYAGIGKVWATSQPNDVPSLEKESLNLNKVFVGANLNMGLVNLALELDQTGDTNSTSFKLGFRF